MSIRTLTELQSEMSGEFAWRKKELTKVKSVVYARRQDANRSVYIRSAVTLLYAHWEGFIKRIGTLYLEFIARQHLPHCDLAAPFLALSMGRLMYDAAAAKKVKGRIEVIDFFRNRLNEKSKMLWKGGVNTKANLGSDVLQDILLTLGLDYAPYETKKVLIDEKLLRNRNHIAHGQYLLVDHGEYLTIHDEILALMQVFYDQVEDAALSGKYRA